VNTPQFGTITEAATPAGRFSCVPRDMLTAAREACMIPNAGGLGFGSPAKPRARYGHDSQQTAACIVPSHLWR